MSEHVFDPMVTARWDELAARARTLIDAERGTSVATRWPAPVHEAIRALQAAIAETEDPTVAEWAVSRWIHLGIYETVVDSVAAERVDTPPRLAARRAGETTRRGPAEPAGRHNGSR